MLIATVVAVVILPLIYAGLYLWAFWDPYAKIEEIPVAVVNEDKGDKSENLGNDLVEKLKENKAMKWDFVDLKSAQSGLNNKKYYSLVIIPDDFTTKIVNADQKDAKSTYLKYENREASSFMAAKFSTSAYNKIQATLNNEITKRYFDEVIKESLKSANKLKEAVDGANKLSDGLHDIATGSAKLNDGLIKAYDGADQVNNGAEKLKNGIDNLSVGVSNVGPLIMAMNMYLADNHDPMMAIYMGKLNGAMSQTKDGVSQLQSGSSDLKNGTNDLRIGIDELKKGSKTINENMVTAEDGSKTLANKLETSRREILNKVKNENSEVLSKPIDLEDSSIDKVDNNGTGFVPYFQSLSLWVGSMAIFFLIDFKKGKKWPKLMATIAIGLVQAMVLDVVLIKILGLKLRLPIEYFEFSIILAVCFGLIEFFLNKVFKEAGKFIAIILLMLQLTSSAGSYPIETVPSFFQKISRYLPMTYSVIGFKEIVSGGQVEVARQMMMIILLTGFGFLLIDIMTIIDWSKIKLPKNNGKHKQKIRHIAVSR